MRIHPVIQEYFLLVIHFISYPAEGTTKHQVFNG